jgi:hypothetical protein
LTPAAALVAAAVAVAPGTADDPLARLWAEGRLTTGESRALERGAIVAKVIETDDRSEVLSFAAASVKTTSARVIARLRDLEGRRSEPWTRQSGRVGEPPSPGDFATLTLDAGDVKDLARGRVNDCDVRFSADAIRRFRQELDGSMPTARDARANGLFRELLAGYAAAYRESGGPALFEYANNGDPVRIADSLERLLQRSPLLRDLAPDVYAFVLRFPAGRPADAEEYLYWAKEKFWLLDVVSLSQVAIVDRRAAAGRLTLAVSKQLYATHYYESSLGLTAFVESQPGTGWLFLINRTRADIRRSGFTWVERLLLNHLVRRRLDARLDHLRAQLEGGSP